MPATLRELIAVVAALLTGGAAVHVLVDDQSAARVGWTADVWGGWLTDPSTGFVIGAIAAVLACAGVSMRGSQRGAWDDVALLGAVIVVVSLAPRIVDGVGFLIATHLLGCVAAGAMLGAGVAVSWGQVSRQAALTAGAVVAVLAAPLRNPGVGLQFLSNEDYAAQILHRTDPNWWVLCAAVVAAIVAAAFTQSGFRLRRPDRRSAVIAVGGVAVLAVVNRLLSDWIYRAESWWVVAVALVVVVVVTVAVALVTDGQFALVALAVAASAAVVVRDLRAAPPSMPVLCLVGIGVLAAVLGMRAARARSNVLLGLAVVAVVPLISAIEPSFGTDGFVSLLRVAVVAAAAGYALSSAFPGKSTVAAAGFGVLIASSVLTAAASPPQPVQRINFAYVVDDIGAFPFGSANSFRLAGFAMLLVIAACAGAVLLSRRRSAVAAGSAR